MAKVLHIIVRHRSNPHPAYPNQWLDDDRIRSIVTYKEIADLCAPMVATASVVRIHRTGAYGEPPVICCEATVEAVRPWSTQFEVEFTDVHTLNVVPAVRPDGKKSWYFADAGGMASGSASTVNAGPNETAHSQTGPSAQPNPDLVLLEPNIGSPASGHSVDCGSRPPSKHLELLQRGIEDWNFARKSKPGVKPDLAGADLREVLGKAGRHASVQLAGADMRRANMAGLAFYEPVLVEASLVGADLGGASWREARLPHPILLDAMERRNLNMRAANLEGANLSQTKFERPVLRGADFRHAKLVAADFGGSDLAGLCFDGADLRRANLRGTNLTDASLDGADLRGADLSTAKVTEQQVRRAITDGGTKLPVDWGF
ncbi:MAG: pentapeptide repeat-containing protein [Bryobacteraceae bacterium]